MELQVEKLNISQIKFVTNYSPEFKSVYRFAGKLPTHELMFFYDGDVTLEFGEKQFFVKTGEMVYLPKGIENDRYRIFSDRRFGLYSIYFDTPDAMPCEAVHIQNQNGKIKLLYDALYRAWAGKKRCYYLKCMQLFYEILQLTAKTQMHAAVNQHHAAFEKVEEYMMAHFCDKDFDYHALAEESGFSYSYFKKQFISQYGLSPNKYITQLRMDCACDLLNIGKYKISEVAEMCGYENVYYFSNVFKKTKGVSPKNYIAI